MTAALECGPTAEGGNPVLRWELAFFGKSLGNCVTRRANDGLNVEAEIDVDEEEVEK